MLRDVEQQQQQQEEGEEEEEGETTTTECNHKHPSESAALKWNRTESRIQLCDRWTVLPLLIFFPS